MTTPEFLPPRPELPDGLVPPPEEQAPERARSVALWVPFAALLASVAVGGTLTIAVLGIASAMDPKIDADNVPDALTIVLTVLLDVILVLGAFVAVSLSLGRVRREDLGFRRVANWRTALTTLAVLYVGYWVVAIILTQIFGEQPEQELVAELKKEDSVAVLAGWAVLTCFVAPICEEIFFRGFMFQAFARKLGVAWGALLAGAVFGLIHAPNPILSLVALGVLGVCLCALYWRTQSIIPCMALHALNNSISFGVTKSLDPVVGAGLVVGSVALVVALATAVSTRTAVEA